MVEVICYSGCQYADEPRALVWDKWRVAVMEVLARWRTPNGKRFRVRTEDERVFDLDYNESNESWIVTEL